MRRRSLLESIQGGEERLVAISAAARRPAARMLLLKTAPTPKVATVGPVGLVPGSICAPGVFTLPGLDSASR